MMETRVLRTMNGMNQLGMNEFVKGGRRKSRKLGMGV